MQRPLLTFRKALERQTHLGARAERDTLRSRLGAPVEEQRKDQQTEVRGESESNSCQGSNEHVGEHKKGVPTKLRRRIQARSKYTGNTDHKNSGAEDTTGETEFQEAIVAVAGPRCDLRQN